MMVKMTLQGGLIYLTFTLFAATVIARRGGWRTIGNAFWGTGFVAAVASVAWRGLDTGHPPMQNLFEFFLCMAAALWPLSVWSRWRNGLDTAVQDALLGMLILFPAGFVFGEDVRRLPPALQSPLFIPHVGSYVAGYVMLARAALMALPLFRRDIGSERMRQAETASRQTAAAGFVLLTLGLVLGSLWGKICWGHYWQFDPKEMWSLATWLVYVGYFHERLAHGVRAPRTLAALLWIGLLFIVLTLTWINLSRLFAGMHNYA
ncbi:MAG TPA: cytochrome c biogenesis protein CcsA [Kiritimatiellia bacterium]|nr:cytochrome c biogenesis protein CcsA [Kiritimatiellia bacterium]HRU71410.1 cytochrome c biogenesis protein CcsA [Kiritimatiellia bacterium]